MQRTLLAAALALGACVQGGGAASRGGATAAPVVRVRIIAFNDFHGNLEPPQEGWQVGASRVTAGGVAHLAAHVRALRAEARHSVVVSAGDLVGASPLLSALFHDEPTIEAMDLLGLDINGVGNHEFDEGLGELLRLAHGGCHPEEGCRGRPAFPGARFSFLAANVTRRSDGRTIFPAYEIRRFDGLPVAFIGLTLEGTPGVLPPVVPELSFADEADTTNRLVEELRREGVRAFVLLVHEGGFTLSDDPNGCAGLSGPIVDILERLDADVDVVVSGHTHRAYVCDLGGRLLTSGGSLGRLLTDIEVDLSAGTGDVLGARAVNRVVDHQLPPVAEVAGSVAFYAERAAPLTSRVVGHLRGSLPLDRDAHGVSGLGRLIADAQLEATRSAGAEVAFMNGGGVRTSIAPPTGPDGVGVVTYGMLFAAQPFQNLLVTMTLTGEEILEALEEQFVDPERPRFLDPSSNLTYAWQEAPSPRPRVVPGSVRLSGVPLDPRRSYRVTVNAYLAGRGPFGKGRERQNGPVDLDALVDHFGRNRPLEAPARDGIRRLDTLAR